MDLGILGLGDATEIGIGGSATVYSARRSGNDREVAVKVLNVADPVFVERFEREGQMLTTLSRSPRIVTVHEAGTTGSGRPYLVLELCTSSLLDRITTEKTLDPLEACRVLADVTEAVADAHLMGVVHRDIKPANILQSVDGDYLVADFGISTVLGSTTTETVTTAFTAGYVAPETLGGERAGAAADIYALGATLFHMVTGSAPFTTDEGESNIFALANRVANETLPDLRLEGVPGVVCDLIELAMAKDPNDRPNAIDFQAMLIDVASGVVTDAPAEEVGPSSRQSPPDKPTIARLVEAPKLLGYEGLELVDRHDGASVFTGHPIREATTAPSIHGHDPLAVGADLGLVDSGSDSDLEAPLPSPVAVRVFDVREFDPVARKMFRSERGSLTALSDHPRLVGLIDHGYTTDGRPFDVEIDLGEETLAFVGQASAPYVWPRVVEVGIMVASAVEVLHQAGLRHGQLGTGALFLVGDGEVALGDYRAVASLTSAEVNAAAEMDADLQSIGRTLLRLAGVSQPASGTMVDWESAMAASETLGEGPRSLRSLLVSLVADDSGSPPATAYEVAVRLQRLQADVGIAETPLLVDQPVEPIVDAPPSHSTNGHVSTSSEAVDIDPNWAPPNNDVAALAAATSDFSLGSLEGIEGLDGLGTPGEGEGAAAESSADVESSHAGVVSQATETVELSEVMAAYHAKEQEDAAATVGSGSSTTGSSTIGNSTIGSSEHDGAGEVEVTRFDPMARRSSRWSDLVDDVVARARSLVGVFIALAALALLVVGIYTVSQRETTPVADGAPVEAEEDASSASTGDLVTAVVPVVADLETEAAVARVENAGFTALVSREFDAGVPRGQIVSSSPAAGDQVELGTTINVVVSRGSEPSCIGSTEPAVRRQLEDRDLTVAGVTRSFSESLDVDRVIRCVIYDDTETAIIVVSGGPRPTEEDG